MNSIGLPNKGLEGYLAHDLPELARLPVPLIVNVMGFTHAEVAQLVRAFAVRDEVSALELNVSCPNVETGTLIGSDPAEVTALLDVVRPLTDKPLIVKLTPNAADVPAVARAAAGRGRRRGLADQHAARDGARPGTGRPWLGGGPAACRDRPCAPSRWPRPLRSARRSGSRSWRWAACRPGATRRSCWRSARRSSRSAPRASGTRSPAPGSPPNSTRSRLPARRARLSHLAERRRRRSAEPIRPSSSLAARLTVTRYCRVHAQPKNPLQTMNYRRN